MISCIDREKQLECFRMFFLVRVPANGAVVAVQQVLEQASLAKCVSAESRLGLEEDFEANGAHEVVQLFERVRREIQFLNWSVLLRLSLASRSRHDSREPRFDLRKAFLTIDFFKSF